MSLLVLCISLLACKKDKEEVMPDYSMTGSNTFAAFVNGQLWVPKGRPSTFQPNLQLIYDPNYNGGSFDIRAYRVNENSNTHELIAMNISQVDRTGLYNLGNRQEGRVLYESNKCIYEGDEGEVEGVLEITKLDLQNGIIAGKFEFTLIKTDCDTVRVTEGRFDKKIF